MAKNKTGTQQDEGLAGADTAETEAGHPEDSEAEGGQADLGLGTKVRVLLDCHYGRADDVVELPAAVLKAAKAAGMVDDHPEAVKYAEGLQAKKAAGKG